MFFDRITGSQILQPSEILLCKNFLQAAFVETSRPWDKYIILTVSLEIMINADILKHHTPEYMPPNNAVRPLDKAACFAISVCASNLNARSNRANNIYRDAGEGHEERLQENIKILI